MSADPATVKPLNILNYDLSDLTEEFGRLYGKGAFHAEAVFRQVSREGRLAPDELVEFTMNRALAGKIAEDFALPEFSVSRSSREGDTVKFCLALKDGLETESVILTMQNHRTLCVSTQIGCRQGCIFCETARMGFVRNLDAAEIVQQLTAARHLFQAEIRNIVFMGMGEPLDNLDAVLKAVDIWTNPKGLDQHYKFISISTSGYLDGLDAFGDIMAASPEKLYHKLHLSVSLNAPSDDLRNSLMPVNRKYPLSQLKDTLQKLPQSRTKDTLFFEYIVIPGVNNTREAAKAVAAFMKGLVAKVNIIPFNPGRRNLYRAPTEVELETFWGWIREEGIECRTRKSRGGSIMAACGQLGNPSLRRAE